MELRRVTWTLSVILASLLVSCGQGTTKNLDSEEPVDAREYLDCDTRTASVDTRSDGIPALVVNPEVLDFGQVFIGEVAELSIALSNVGSGDLEISGFKLSGSQRFTLVLESSEYTTSQETVDGVLIDPPLPLEPSAQVVLNVRFEPMDESEADGVLTFLSNDPTQPERYVLLIGNEAGSCIAVQPQKLAFVGTLVGDVAAKPIEFWSCGDLALEIFDLRLSEDSSADFGLDLSGLDFKPTAEQPLTLPPGDVATVYVTFQPDTKNPTNADGLPIPDAGTLIVVNNTFYQTKEVLVIGVGTDVPCPTAVIQCAEGNEVNPQTILHLYGDQSYASNGAITKWSWSVETPLGSQSVFIPSDTFPNPTFEANVAGKHTFKLTVYDEHGVESCTNDTFDVLVH